MLQEVCAHDPKLQEEIDKINVSLQNVSKRREELLLALSKINQESSRLINTKTLLLSNQITHKDDGYHPSDTKTQHKKHHHERLIEEPEFPKKIVTMLHAQKILTIKDLLRFSNSEILALPYSSRNTLEIIKKILLAYGFALREQKR